MRTVMTRRKMLMSSTLGAILALSGKVFAQKKKRPNIIILESDSMDGRVMGCMGHPAAYTPNMDKLAKRGVLFKNTYCNSPQCCPSRSSMWSGKHTHEVEGWNNYKGLEPGSPTFKTVLEDAGYTNFVTGKTDYVSGGHSIGARVWAWTRAANITLPQKARPEARLDKAAGKRHKKEDWKQIDKSIDFLKQHSGDDAPFMLYCGIGIPHPPFHTSQYWLDKIDPAKVTLPPYEKDLHPVMEYMSATKHTLGDFTEKEILDIRRTYFAMIAECDAMVGALMDAVKEQGLADNTYFLYLSDHGEMNMEHRQQLKNSLQEASARVPLLIAGPDVKAGTVVENLVSLVDMYPTFMDMAGLAHPEGLSGHSLMPLMQGEQDKKRPDWVLSQYHSNFANTGIFMLRQGPWKYIAYAGYESQLFNLKEDPDEMVNLVKSNPEMAQRMDAKLREQVDCDAVDAKAKAYDKAAFLEWRAGQKPEQYERAMNKMFDGAWSKKYDAQIAAWLGE